MPRSKSFEPERTLARVVEVFWRRGYAATSMDTLVRHTGVSRSSLYATFGAKDELFRHALRHYDRVCRRALLGDLARRSSGLEAIGALFGFWIERALAGGDRRGCLLANAAAELDADRAPAGRFVARTQRHTQAFLRRQIERGQRSGEIPAAVDATAASASLLAGLMGMLLLIRTRAEPALLRVIAHRALASLR